MKLFALGILLSVNAMFNSIAVKGQDMAPTIQKILADTSLSVEEKLVALALNGPYYAGTEYQNKIVGYQLKGAKNSWLNILSLSFNYNNQAISNPNLPNTSLFPKFFFGMTVPLGLVFSRTEVKAAKAKNEETARLLNLQLQQSLLKIELEKVIGVPLELVLVK